MEEGIGILFITSLNLFKLYAHIILIKIKIELKGKHKKEWKINGSCFPKLNLIMENLTYTYRLFSLMGKHSWKTCGIFKISSLN